MPNRTAADIMTKKVITVSPDTDIYKAIQILVKKQISGVPVVDKNGNLQGMLSEYDCLKVMAGEAFHGLPEGKVADYMSCSTQTIKPEARILDIVRKFLAKPNRRLPVMDEGGQLVGQISRRDVLKAIESMRENRYLYGTKEEESYPPSADDARGVDSAMKSARARK